MRQIRAAIIRAGAEVLSREGPGATVGEIARGAGVTQSAFFSHFASKDDLVSVLVVTHTEALQEIATRHAVAEKPGIEQLLDYFWDASEAVAPHRAYLEVANHIGAYSPAAHVAAERLDATVGRLVTRAHAEGEIRAGVTAMDVHALMMIATLAAAPFLDARPNLWRRYVAISVASLRRRTSRRLPVAGLELQQLQGLAEEAQRRRRAGASV